jgi:hypothetical protein
MTSRALLPERTLDIHRMIVESDRRAEEKEAARPAEVTFLCSHCGSHNVKTAEDKAAEDRR